MSEEEYEAIKQKFADFAKECGLEEFPAPDGGRAVYGTDMKLAGKKIEYTGLIDDLWNALARSKGRDDMCVPIGY